MEKKIKEIFEVVAEIIEDSIGTPKEEIGLNQTLFDELEIDSIDLVRGPGGSSNSGFPGKPTDSVDSIDSIRFQLIQLI